MDTAREELSLTCRDLAIGEVQDLGYCMGGMEIGIVSRRRGVVEKTQGSQSPWYTLYAPLWQG